MKKNKSVLFGWLALLVSIILFSTVEIVGKKINAKATIEPFTMVFLRFFLTGIVLTCLSLPGYFRRGNRLGLNDLKHFLVNGAVGIAVSISLFHAAIEMFTNASSSAVVFSANGVFTAVLARFMNNEAWSWRKWCAVVFGIFLQAATFDLYGGLGRSLGDTADVLAEACWRAVAGREKR